MLLVAALLIAVTVAGPYAWTHGTAAGHLNHSAADAPDAPVVIVFGAQLAPGGAKPKPFLAGRLDVAADLFRRGKVKAVLVSGDGSGTSGDETAAMAAYLVSRGVPSDRVVADPSGLDTYDTCSRAAHVYGVRRALLVSQSFHLPRAVTLCRELGIDAHGVDARCDGCRWITLRTNEARELGANVKAGYDVLSGREPKVGGAPDGAVLRITGGGQQG
jgi:vancomycin permeability regulator SanA